MEVHFADFSEDPYGLFAVQIFLAVWSKLRNLYNFKGAGRFWSWGLLLYIAVGRSTTCFPTFQFDYGQRLFLITERVSITFY